MPPGAANQGWFAPGSNGGGDPPWCSAVRSKALIRGVTSASGVGAIRGLLWRRDEGAQVGPRRRADAAEPGASLCARTPPRLARQLLCTMLRACASCAPCGLCWPTPISERLDEPSECWPTRAIPRRSQATAVGPRPMLHAIGGPDTPLRSAAGLKGPGRWGGSRSGGLPQPWDLPAGPRSRILGREGASGLPRIPEC